MKKTIILSAITLCALTHVNAKTFSTTNTAPIENAYFFKVNSFCVSIAKGDLETVQKLLARGADVNEKSNGMTPLMYAAKFNRTEILTLLIKHGANLKAKSSKKMTALDYAELHGAVDTAAILKEAIINSKKKK